MLRTLLMGAALIAAGTNLALGADDDKPRPEQIAAIADKLSPSLVKVEYVAQYDKGEAPDHGSSWGSFRNYFSGHMDEDDAGAMESGNWEELIRQERPGERGGYLVSPTRVFTSDPMLHSRFIKSITVRFGDQVATAKPAGYPNEQGGYFLELDHPFNGAKPLAFDPSKQSPFMAISYAKRDTEWGVRIGSMRSGMVVSADGRRFVPSPGLALITDKEGTPVTLTADADLGVDGAWKADPSKWPTVSASELERDTGAVESQIARNLVRVRLNFRSPRNQSGDGRFNYMARYREMAEGEQEAVNTEWNGEGLVLDSRTLLVFANFKSKMTGRLEHIHAFLPDGTEMSAKFDGTLKDWGAIVAKLDSPAAGAAHPASGPITAQRDKLLLKAEVAVRGETRTIYFGHERIGGFANGYQGKVFPTVSAGDRSYGPRYGDTSTGYKHFLYTLTGDLVAVPLERREKVTAQQNPGFNYSYYSGGEGSMVPVGILLETMAQGQSAYDTDNRPVSEEEENRVAWIGAEMQGMTPDLARANNCVEQTNGGASGGIITFLYENSPATKSDLHVGDILLRLHIEGQPKPLEVMVEDRGEMAGMMDQFWQYLDRMPEEYMDQMPKPWGSVENALTTSLTEVGFGTKFTAEVLRDGKVTNVPMVVTQGPAHYDSAPRFKTEEMGVTVRDMTYEVRRYFQMKPDDVGVIVSKVERGSKASVAGLKPMEIVRSVDDKPVNNVKEFEAAIKSGGEFKLAVKRMTKGRTIKVKIEPAGTGAPDADKIVGKPPEGGPGKGIPPAAGAGENPAPTPPQKP